MCCVAKTRCYTNTIRMTIICVGPYIFIITKPFRCRTMPRHKIDENPEGTILGLFKSGSGVSQIQRQLNRDNFDVTRMTITNVINKHGKEQKIAIWNKKKHVVYRRYQKAIPDAVKKIRTMILKTNPANKRDIVNELGLSIVTIYHVIKHPLICRVAKKPNVNHLTQTKVEKRRKTSWRLYRILNAETGQNILQLTWQCLI